MNKLDEILGQENISSIITGLKEKNYQIPTWESIEQDYVPSKHKIATDNVGRKDKIVKSAEGNVVSMDKASRIYIGLEMLHTKRISEFMFTLPLKRVYHNTEGNSKREEIANILELIYKHARDAELDI